MAARISPPSHGHLENTLASIRAAFELGAEVVELDIHPTTDGHFAVFHDWRLECSTNGTGVTRERSLAYLQTLDIGHGYTADGGETFPFRGRGVGSMPSLTDVLDAFPDGRLLIHLKGNDADDGDRLAALLRARPHEHLERLMVYGGDASVARLLALVPELRGYTRNSLETCLVRYTLMSWTGIVPDACAHTVVLVPQSAAPYLWGWRRRFLLRMRDADTEVVLVRIFELEGSYATTGIDSLEEVPDDDDGLVWTNKIEVVAMSTVTPRPASSGVFTRTGGDPDRG